MNAPTRLEFLRRRQAGIGGSDVAAILGLSPWKTPLDVFLSKTQPITEDEQSEPAYWGIVLEDVVAKEYVRRSGNTVQRINAQIQHPQHAFIVANIDRAVVVPGSRVRLDDAGHVRGAQGVLECKTASAYVASAWGRDDDDDAIPTHYAAQGMAYLGITGLPWVDYACLIGGQKFVTKRLERDEAVIEAINAKLVTFWNEHVVAGVPPAPINSADVLTLFGQDDGSQIDATGELLININEAKSLREQIAQAEDALEQRTEAIKLAMGGASAVMLDGKSLVTWKAPKPSSKTDWEAVAMAAGAPPEVIAAHTKQVPGSRRFCFARK